MNKKHLRILELLIGGDKSVQEISYQLNISERTLSNYIIQINDYFKRDIKVAKKYGRYSLVVTDDQRFRHLLHQLRKDMTILEHEQQQRRAEVFHILNHHSITVIDDLADQLHLSKSVISSIIAELKEIAADYSISIKGTPNVGLKVNGTEFNIRKMLVNQFQHYYAYFEVPEAVMNLIGRLKILYHLDEGSLNRLEAAVKVTLNRLENGHFITEKLNVDRNIYESKDYNNFKDFIDYISDQYEVQYVNDEVLLLVIQILGRRASIIDDIISNDDESLLRLIIQNTIDDIRRDFKIQIDESLFTKDVQLHLKYLINRLIFGVKLNNDALGDVQQKFPLAFELSKVLAKNIEQFIKIDVPINELGFLSIYFSIFIEELNEKLRAIKKIAIITDQGLSTSKMIESNLKSVMNENIEIGIFIREEAESETLRSYDLIISTIKINRLFNKVIFIEDILDKKLLKLKIEQFLIYKDVSKETLINHNVLLDYLREDDVVHINEAIEYTEAIRILSNTLIDEGKVDQYFTQRILEREESVSTISNNIGFPHSVHQCEEIHLKLAILNKGLVDHGDIKLIILLGIPDHYANEAMLIRLYEEILSLSTNHFALSNIDQNTHYNDLVYLLNHERGI